MTNSLSGEKAAHIECLPTHGSPDLLFLLFHGVGADAGDMAPLAHRLAAEYPQAAIVSIQAPYPFDAMPGGGSGRQWFSIGGIDDRNRPQRVADALPSFIATVRVFSERFTLPHERVALAGFSQGAIMALEAVQAEPALAGRVLAFSGRHATPPSHVPVDTTVHLFHGLGDRVVPPAAVVDAAERLLKMGGDVTADLLPGIEHELHPQLLDKAIGQLRTFLPHKVWRQAMQDAPVLSRVASSRELDPPVPGACRSD